MAEAEEVMADGVAVIPRASVFHLCLLTWPIKKPLSDGEYVGFPQPQSFQTTESSIIMIIETELSHQVTIFNSSKVAVFCSKTAQVFQR